MDPGQLLLIPYVTSLCCYASQHYDVNHWFECNTRSRYFATKSAMNQVRLLIFSDWGGPATLANILKAL